MTEATVGTDPAPAAGKALVAGRGCRKTLAPGALERISPASISCASTAQVGSRFEVLVEEASDSSSEVSCDFDVPFETAMEVVGTPASSGWSTVIRRGRRTDEELAADFWSDIGYPAPASHFWENVSPSSCAGMSNVPGCRDSDGAPATLKGQGGSPPTQGLRRDGASSLRGIKMQRRARARTWRGTCPPHRISPPAILGHFIKQAEEAGPPATFERAEVSPGAVIEEEKTGTLHGGGPGGQQFS